jgi:hypothetical protein
MPHNVRIQRIPPPVKFQRGPLRYTADYKRSGNLVTVRRHFIADRPSHTCTPADEEDWQAFLAVLRRDLRGQVFVK